MRLATLQTFDQHDKRTKRQKDKRTKGQKDKKTKRQKYKKTKKLRTKRHKKKRKKKKRQKDKRQRPKREFDIATSGQFPTLGMFSYSNLFLNVGQWALWRQTYLLPAI